MKYCQNCGDELPVSAHFCGSCGFTQNNKVETAEQALSVQPSTPSSFTAVPDSLASTRSAVVKMNKHKKSTGNKYPGFWIAISLMICLIGGLAAYIISTYLFSPTSNTTQASNWSKSAQPILSLPGSASTTVKQGQTLTLHGERFRANDPISFLLDSIYPITNQNNQDLSVRASSGGSFDVSIPIQGSDWSANSHYIQGIDNLTKQDADLTVLVTPASAPETASPNLALSMDDKTVTTLKFHALVGQSNPPEQNITLINTSGAPLTWTATASADDNLNWLMIDNSHLAGNLDIYGTDSIGISVFTTGLKTSQKPYTGQIVFTINGEEQLVLPVELQVVDAESEVVFTPNPAFVALGAGGTCQATTFTLINVGNTFINWTLSSSDGSQNFIQFIADNGQPVTQGQLALSGVPGDTQTLTLQCTGVSAGHEYNFVLYAGDAQSPVSITIQG